jgi:hypothetical protein
MPRVLPGPSIFTTAIAWTRRRKNACATLRWHSDSQRQWPESKWQGSLLRRRPPPGGDPGGKRDSNNSDGAGRTHDAYLVIIRIKIRNDSRDVLQRIDRPFGTFLDIALCFCHGSSRRKLQDRRELTPIEPYAVNSAHVDDDSRPFEEVLSQHHFPTGWALAIANGVREWGWAPVIGRTSWVLGHVRRQERAKSFAVDIFAAASRAPLDDLPFHFLSFEGQLTGRALHDAQASTSARPYYAGSVGGSSFNTIQ